MDAPSQTFDRQIVAFFNDAQSCEEARKTLELGAGVRVSMIHGSSAMARHGSPAEQAAAKISFLIHQADQLERFSKHEKQVLLSTSKVDRGYDNSCLELAILNGVPPDFEQEQHLKYTTPDKVISVPKRFIAASAL